MLAQLQELFDFTLVAVRLLHGHIWRHDLLAALHTLVMRLPSVSLSAVE